MTQSNNFRHKKTALITLAVFYDQETLYVQSS